MSVGNISFIFNTGFNLATECPNHPLVFALAKKDGGGTSTQSTAPSPSPTINNNQVVVDKTVANVALDNLEHNSSNPDTVEICSIHCNLFSLN